MLRMGHKTKITLRFRGRERQRPDLGAQLLAKVCEDLSGIANVDQEITAEQHQINTVLSLKKGIKRIKPNSAGNNSEDGEGEGKQPVATVKKAVSKRATPKKTTAKAAVQNKPAPQSPEQKATVSTKKAKTPAPASPMPAKKVGTKN
jgi:translation initiation factor IF-3